MPTPTRSLPLHAITLAACGALVACGGARNDSPDDTAASAGNPSATQSPQRHAAAVTVTPVALKWDSPIANTVVGSTLQFRLSGQAFKNVEIFQNGRMVVRATVSPDMTTATASLATSQFADGPVTFTAHAWNSAPGTAFTSEKDAGTLTVVVRKAAGSWVKVAGEWGTFNLGSKQRVRYGANSSWIEKTLSGPVTCTNEFFGSDPLFNVLKRCEVFQEAQAPAPAPVPAPAPPAPPAPPPPPPSPSPAPSPAPAGFWNSGTDGLDRNFHNAFGAWRGRPSTSAWINLLWLPWDWLTAPGLNSTLNGRDPSPVWPMYANFPGVIVLSMSMAGASENITQQQYDANMRTCAAGGYNGYWQSFAANAAAAGRNGDNTVVSLAQEFNGTWFKWNPKTVGVDTWKSCWKNVYTAIHSRSSVKVAWVFSATTVTSNAGSDWSVNNVWDAYPGDAYVDVIGVNHYDFKMFPATSNWRNTCGNTQDICYAAEYARTHGKKFGMPEWGPDREKGYADNAEFIQMMYQFFQDNRDVLLFENTFNTILGGTPGWWHIYPESSINTKAAARYRQLW